ncbi:hypothetical protein [Thermoflexus hugenholtzii]
MRCRGDPAGRPYVSLALRRLRERDIRPEPEGVRRALRDGRIRDLRGTPWIMPADCPERNPKAIEDPLSRPKA